VPGLLFEDCRNASERLCSYYRSISSSYARNTPLGTHGTIVSLIKAKKITDIEPQTIYTDGLPTYLHAIKKEFGRHARFGDHAKGGYWTPHKRVPSIKAAESNNIVERLHGTEKSRTKVMRAFDQLGGAASLMDGWRVHYDIVRDHMALGMTPAEAAGIPKLEGFRWHELLKLATTRISTPIQGGGKSP